MKVPASGRTKGRFVCAFVLILAGRPVWMSRVMTRVSDAGDSCESANGTERLIFIHGDVCVAGISVY